jgi:hypothetical protein
MAGFVIAMAACLLPFGLGLLGLGRARIAIIGGVLALVCIVGSAAMRPTDSSEYPPLWFTVGLILLLYAIWCGGLWLGVRLRRMRQATPG